MVMDSFEHFLKAKDSIYSMAKETITFELPVEHFSQFGLYAQYIDSDIDLFSEQKF